MERTDQRTPTEWTISRMPQALCGVELTSARYAHEFPLHVHPECVVVGIVDGTERFRHGSRDLAASQGQMILLNPYDEHTGYAAERSWTYLGIRIEPDDMSRWQEGTLRFSNPVENDPECFRLLGALHAMEAQGAPALALQSLLAELIGRLATRNAGGGRANPLHQEAVRLARERLDDDPVGDCDLVTLAAYCGIRPLTLLRAFRREVGCTPHIYRTAKRVRIAKQALKCGKPIVQVAAETGFYDQSHFTRVFREWTGVTPGSFAETII